MKNISFEAAREYIAKLDLAYISESMCTESYSLPRWTKEDAGKCCQLYKNFLLLQKKHLPLPLVPTREIDEYWHNHILHTKNYVEDCEHIFGHYLHHQPKTPADASDTLIADFLQTKALYLAEFGVSLTLQDNPPKIAASIE